MNLSAIPEWLSPRAPECGGPVREHRLDTRGMPTVRERGRSVFIQGKRFATMRAAARHFKVSKTTVYRWEQEAQGRAK